MPRATTSLLLLTVGLLCASADARSAQTAASGRVLTFLAAPSAQQAADPTVALPFEPFEARAGDVLTYLVRAPDGRSGVRGIEVAYADGRRSRLGSETLAPGAWSPVRVPLRERATVQKVELVARGFSGGQIAFQVDEVRIERADGDAIDIFRDDLAGLQRRVSGLASSAGLVVVDIDDAFGPYAVVPGADVDDPWAAIDLTALRALDREPDPTDASRMPRGLVWTGPCVPLRFARHDSRVSFAARGQRIGFEPLDGGRFYELWLAVSNTSDDEIVTSIAVQGVDRERVGIPLRIPARGPDGYTPAEDEGYPAREFALLEIDVASPTSLASLQLPDDPRLRILAVTIAWRRDGATDPRFRARWFERVAATRPELAEADRGDLARYLANRRAGAIFGGVAYEGDAERSLFDTLLAGDMVGFRARLSALLADQSKVAQGRKSARIELIATLPRVDRGSGASAPRAEDDLASALEPGVLPVDLPVVGGDARALEALAARDPAAFARLVERAQSGTWRTFGVSLDRASAARLGADALARKFTAEKRATERLLGGSDAGHGGASTLARVEGHLGRLEHLPQLLVATGMRSVLLESTPKGIGSPFSRWISAGSELVTIAPSVRIEGPLRLDPAIWRGWTQAAESATGRPPIPVLCDVSAPVARETLALAEDLARSEMAPDLSWTALEDVAEAARARAQTSDAPPLAALSRVGMQAELAALAAVRAAERELARCSVVESLAVLDGAPAPGRALASAWSALHRAAELEPVQAIRAAREVIARLLTTSTARLARLQAAVPHPGVGVPIAVLDPIPWPRQSLFELPDAELRVAGSQGDLPMQRTASGGLLVEFSGAGTTPTALRVRRDPLAETKAPARVRLEGWTIKTDDLDVAIDPSSGRITRLTTRTKDLDLLGDGGDRLTWIAEGSPPEPIETVEKIEFVERGPLRAIVRSVRSSPRARVETEIRVTSGTTGLEIRTRVELLDRSGDVVLGFPLARTTPNALSSIPLGFATVAPDAAILRPIDGWVAATDGSATFALIGESGAAYRWNERAFDVVLAEAGADAAREVSFRVLARAGGWKAAGLEATVLERALDPVRVAFDAPGQAAAPREPLVRIARIERDGRRTYGAASGIVPLAIEPGSPGTVDVRLLEVRGEAARVEIVFAREPFGAERVDLLGNALGSLTVTGRAFDVSIGAGRLESVRAQLAP